MVKILEMTVIGFFLVAEGATMTTGELPSHLLARWKNKLNIVLLLALVIVGLGYLAFAVVWCFDGLLPVKVAGMILIGMSLVGLALGTPRTKLWLQIDALISMLCLTAVGYCRVRGF